MHLVRHMLRWPLGCLFFITACNSKRAASPLDISSEATIKENRRIDSAFAAIEKLKAVIKTGDLVVRTGNDFTSESLRSLNQRDKTYSHCGIASVEHDTVFVYHALGGEFNPDQKIRKDILPVFAEPYSNRGIGIYRYELDEAVIMTLMQTVKQLYALGIMFDMKFDLQTNDRMYCAEFVYKSYVMGTNGRLQFATSHLGDFNFVGVDDLFLQPQCHLQKKISYRDIKTLENKITFEH